MGRGRSTPLSNVAVQQSRLTDKQRKFVAEYCVDYNARQAAIRAGFPSKTAQAMSAKLMKDPLIMRAIGKYEQDAISDLQIQKKEILTHLHHCATRNGLEFVDEKGNLLPINKLSIRAAACIDNIKQRTKTYVDESGQEHTVTETEYKLVSKSSAIDMAMKHLGAYVAQEVHHSGNVQLNWEEMYGPPDDTKVLDATEYRIMNPELGPPEVPPKPDVNNVLSELIEEQIDE